MLLGGGSGGGDTRQSDWEGQTGDDWDTFASGFEDGFADGCSQLFDLSPNGSLYDDGVEYTVDDCTADDPGDPDTAGADVPVDVPDDPQSAGYDLGVQAGCNAIFDEQGLEELYYGRDGFTADDCVSGGGGSSSAPSEPPSTEPAEPPSTTPNDQPTEPPITPDDYGMGVAADTWGGYPRHKQLAVAELFARNNPNDCRGVDPAKLRKSVNRGYGTDFAFADPVKKLLLSYCKGLSGRGE